VGARKDLEEATRAVADSQADLAAAQAAATAADAVASRSVVRATFDGVVAKRSHNPGDLVEASASDAVLRIIDPRRLEVTAQVPLGDVPRIRVGAPARVVSPATGDGSPVLTVVSRPAAAQEGTPSVPIRLAFKAPPRYPVGAPVEVEIEAEQHRNVVLIPTAGLVHEGEEAAVFVANADKAERRKVTVGLVDDEHAEIVNGVKPGDAVIVTNTNGLSDEAKISIGDTKAEGGAGKAEKDDKAEKDEK
jgi:RND family efflux transporter MFP subunit